MSDFVTRYDKKILDPGITELYGGKGFYNVGEWTPDTKDINEASKNLVARHLYLHSKDDLSPKTVIDAGCGLGAGTEIISKFFPEANVLGLNISKNQIDLCKRRGSGKVEYIMMDAADIQYDSNSVDLIVSIEAAFHFNTRKKFLDSCFRILRPGGYLIYSDILFLDTSFVGTWSVPDENNVDDIDEYNDMIQKTEFVVVSQEDITDRTWNSFCSYLAKFAPMKNMAKGLQKSVSQYLLNKLTKPLTNIK